MTFREFIESGASTLGVLPAPDTEREHRYARPMTDELIDDKNSRVEDPQQIDPILRFLVGVANKIDDPGFSIGFTLTVGGTLITGHLIAAPTWMDLVSEQLQSDDPEQEATQAFGDAFTKFSADLRSQHDEDDAGSPEFIHLSNAATVVTPNGFMPTNRQGLWRGKLSDVQGWTLGILGPV